MDSYTLQARQIRTEKDRQAGGLTERHVVRETEKDKTDREVDRETGRQTLRQTDKQKRQDKS